MPTFQAIIISYLMLETFWCQHRNMLRYNSLWFSDLVTSCNAQHNNCTEFCWFIEWYRNTVFLLNNNLIIVFTLCHNTKSRCQHYEQLFIYHTKWPHKRNIMIRYEHKLILQTTASMLPQSIVNNNITAPHIHLFYYFWKSSVWPVIVRSCLQRQ